MRAERIRSDIAKKSGMMCAGRRDQPPTGPFSAAPRTTRRSNFMKKMLLTGVALGLGLAFSSAANAQIKIGVAGPITGPNAAFGTQLKNGAEQAVGGINGQKLQVVVGDDVSDPKQGVSIANKFAAEGVKMVVGHFNSGVSIPSSEVYQEAGIIQITPASTISRARWRAAISPLTSKARRSPSSTTRPLTERVSRTRPRRPWRARA